MEQLPKNKKIIVYIIAISIISVVVLGLTICNKVISFKLINSNELKEENIKDEDLKKDNSKDQENEDDTMTISYSTEKYTSVNKNGLTITENSCTYPKIIYKRDQNIADKIENSINEIIDNEWQLVKESAEEIALASEDLSADDVLGLGADIYLTEYIDNKILTFYISIEGEFGARSYIKYQGFNYDRQTGELLTLNSITNNYQELYNIILEKYNEEKNKLELEEVEVIYEPTFDELEKMINETGNWFFTEDGLEIILDGITAGYMPWIEILIDKDTVNDLLTNEFKY